MADELLPCPFCGEQPDIRLMPSIDEEDIDCCLIECINESCVSTWAAQTYAEMARAWNTRQHASAAIPEGYFLVPIEIEPEASLNAGKDLEYYEKELPQTAYHTRFEAALQRYIEAVIPEGEK